MLFPAYETIPGDPSRGYLIVCDHASNAVPPELGDLGLPEAAFARHIAYDIGVRAVTLGLAERLGVPAVLSCFSRLVIDPNRGEDDPTLLMRLSDGAVIPGNAHADATERERRLEAYYRPYHAAVTAAIETSLQAGQRPALISIHSFTPYWKETPRPWHAGVLWSHDPRLAVPLLKALSACSGLIVGDNEPYSGELEGDCMYRHGTLRDLPHALVEIRQDLIDRPDGVAEWITRLADIFSDLSQDPAIWAVR
ncbi:MAG: N-formylglutamate amidohydrolase [Pseudomonadota bacterium]